MSHWAARPATLPSWLHHRRPYTIAISREAGASGGTVAREIGARLSWPVYDRELLERIASDAGIQTKLLESVDEQSRGWIAETLENLFGVPHVTESKYVHRLVDSVLALASRGKCVIVGRGSTAILPRSSTLRVRLVAPLEHRVEVLRKRLNLDEKAAHAKAMEQDKQRNEFARSNFHCDAENPSHYDLVLNTATFSPAECADLIVDALNRRQKSAGCR